MMIKNYLKSYAWLLGMIITSTIVISILNYFIVFNTKIIKLLIPIISIFVSSIILGKNTKSKAYLEGIRFCVIYIILSMLTSLILGNVVHIKLVISYLLTLISGVVGAMIGINLNRENNM